MSYLVMECHEAYAVVLSDDGRFMKTANMHYEVGQCVSNVVEMVLPKESSLPKKKANVKWIYAFASMAACLVLAFGTVFMNYMPYAAVYMAINPEVRIDVSRSDRVIGVTGVNADGITLLEGYEQKSNNLDYVIDELVALAIEKGFLHEGGKVSISLDAEDKWVSTHETELNERVKNQLIDKMSITIDILPQKPTPIQNISDGEQIEIPLGDKSDLGVTDNIEEKKDNSAKNEPANVNESTHVSHESTSDDKKEYSNNSNNNAHGESAYGESPYGEESYGKSSYGDSSYGYTEDKNSPYGERKSGRSDTNYDSPDDGNSPYGRHDDDDDNDDNNDNDSEYDD